MIQHSGDSVSVQEESGADTRLGPQCDEEYPLLSVDARQVGWVAEACAVRVGGLRLLEPTGWWRVGYNAPAVCVEGVRDSS